MDKQRESSHITTVFGINKSDTKHLFDDVRLATAVPPQPSNHVTLPPTVPEPVEEEEEKMVRELVVKLPLITDGQYSAETTSTNSMLGEVSASLTSQPNSHYRDSKRHTEFLPQAMPTAVCEVFQFSDGNVDNLKPSGVYQATSLAKPAERRARAANRQPDMHRVDLNSSNGRSLSATRRLTFLQTMKKYYKSQPVNAVPTKLPDINRDCIQLTTLTQRDTKSSPGKMSVSADPPANSLASTTPGSSQQHRTHSNSDWDEMRSKMATRGESQWSWRSTRSTDNVESSRTKTEVDDRTPWPGNTSLPDDEAAMSVTIDDEEGKHEEDLQANRKTEEALKIYHVTRSRERRGRESQGVHNNSNDDNVPRSQYPIKSLSIDANKLDTEPEVNSLPVRQTTNRQTASNVVEPEVERRRPPRTRTEVHKPVEENKMFGDSYYDQFSHRKLKKTLTPGERKRTRAQANNAISKQYDRKDALQYIKVKIGRLGRESVGQDIP